MTVSHAVARNTYWYGLEVLLSVAAGLIGSIAVARHFGPTALGYYNYLVWLTNMTGLLGTVALPLTARKYMAEHLGRGEKGLARSVFERTLRVQVAISLALAAIGAGMAAASTDAAHRAISLILALSILPRTLAFIPSQANIAAEDIRRNVPGALAASGVQLVAIATTILMGRGLLGIAIGVFAGYSVELFLKMRSVRWVYSAPAAPLPPDLRRRMSTFSRQGLVLLLLDIVVWERSDIVFLKILNADIRQVTFFAVAFNVAERLLIAPQVIGGAIGVSLMAQFDRDRSQTMRMTSTAFKYLMLCNVPLLIGAACLSRPAILLLYGAPYAPVAPVLVIVALFAIAKSVFAPTQVLLQASENQRVLVWWSCCCGILNIALDILLVPSLGAIGAAIANGSAQVVMFLGAWAYVRRVFHVELPAAALSRIVASAGVMALIVVGVTSRLSPWLALLAGVVLGATTFLLMIRWTSALEKTDVERLKRSRLGSTRGVEWAIARMVKA